MRISTSEYADAGSSLRNGHLSVYILFFLSGFPALIYHIVWQRSLFSIYGVNIESVTMVVSAFVLGLGLGSLLGGFISTAKRYPSFLRRLNMPSSCTPTPAVVQLSAPNDPSCIVQRRPRRFWSFPLNGRLAIKWNQFPFAAAGR